MRNNLLLNCIILVVIALLLGSCGQTIKPSPTPTLPVQGPYPPPGVYPPPEKAAPEINPSSTSTPAPTSSTGGTVIGVLLTGSPASPPVGIPIYLGNILLTTDGTPGLTSMDRTTSPRSTIGPDGKFVFTNVPPDQYTLILDQVTRTVVLRNLETGGDLIFEVKEGEIVDLGTLSYPDLIVNR